MIEALSRYSTYAEERNGNTVIVSVRKQSVVPSYISYNARFGDTFSNLSARYLGSPLFYWKIADINPQVPFPNYIPVGTSIRIPQ